MVVPPTVYSYYGVNVPAIKSALSTHLAILDDVKKFIAKSDTVTEEKVLAHRIIDDMLPFAVQVNLYGYWASQFLVQYKLVPAEKIPTLADSYQSIDEIVEVVAGLLAAYDSVDEASFNETIDKPIEVEVKYLGTSIKIPTGSEYLQNMLLPSVSFHVNAIYMLARSLGSPLGKTLVLQSYSTTGMLDAWKLVFEAKAKKEASS